MDRYADPTEETIVPQPSQKELELVELANKEKANLPHSRAVSEMLKKMNGEIKIGTPSLKNVNCFFFIMLFLKSC